jgi:hypothetical protein
LIDRQAACQMLGNISATTAQRLERQGKLTPRKLSGTPLGRTYYSRAEVVALAEAKMPRALTIKEAR